MPKFTLSSLFGGLKPYFLEQIMDAVVFGMIAQQIKPGLDKLKTATLAAEWILTHGSPNVRAVRRFLKDKGLL